MHIQISEFPASLPLAVFRQFGFARAGLGSLLLVGLTACRVIPDSPDLSLPVPEQFTRAGTAELIGQWWSSFGDAELDRLVAEALTGNFSLRTAWDRLAQAEAVAAKSRAPLRPSLDGTAGAGRSVTRAPDMDRQYATDLDLGLAAGYEVDLWGRIQSAAEAASFDTGAAAADVQAAAISLSATVAQTWFKLVEQRAQLALLESQIEINRQYLEVITRQFRAGQVSITDVLQQRQVIEGRAGQRAQVQASMDVLEHTLAVLLGRPPGTLAATVPDALPRLPAAPATGVPAELMRRRPDLRAAEMRVRAADRDVATAIADRFPRFQIGLTASTSAEKARDLFDNWLASLAGNLTAPLFDAGQRRAEVDRARATLAERLNSYRQTVLEALQEVEDALAREQRQAEYVASLERQMELSTQAMAQILNNYTKGTVEFTRYLTALLAHQSLQATHLEARLHLVLNRIGLYRALGGATGEGMRANE